MRKARERKQKYLSKDQEEHHRLLVPRSDSNHCSNSSGRYAKDNILALVTGHAYRRCDEDRRRMERHLKYSSLDHAMDPKEDSYNHKFNRLEVPIMDILAVDTERDHGWKYPSRETMMRLQANRGLARSMLRTSRRSSSTGTSWRTNSGGL